MHRTAPAWLYCTDCWELLHNKATVHVPFRDKASQGNLVTGDWKDRKRKLEEHEAEAGGTAAGSQDSQTASAQESMASQAGDTGASQAPVLPFARGAASQEDLGIAQDDPVFDIAEDEEKGDVIVPDVALGEGGDEEPQELLPEVPEQCDFPSMEQYEAKWAALFVKHSKPVAGSFAPGNLVPKPVPQLWQDCPFVAFDALESPQGQARLSMCKPISGLQENSVVNGVERYAHILGDVHFSRRAAWQLASTMGFIVRKNSGSFLGLKPKERLALHEILCWSTRPGNNPVLKLFGEELQAFDSGCREIMHQFGEALPQGSLRARIRATNARETLQTQEAELSTALGDEATGFVMIDLQGHPIKYPARV